MILILTTSPNLTALYQTCTTRKTTIATVTLVTILSVVPTHQDISQPAKIMQLARWNENILSLMPLIPGKNNRG